MRHWWPGAAAALLATTAFAQTADIRTNSGTIAAAPAGQAQVVFFRPGSFVGAAVGCTVHEGGREIARLGSGKYYVVTMQPGTHQLYTEAENHDRLTLEVESGETYFVKCRPGMGIMGARPNLSPSNRDEFAGRAAHLSLWTPSSDWEARQQAAAANAGGQPTPATTPLPAQSPAPAATPMPAATPTPSSTPAS